MPAYKDEKTGKWFAKFYYTNWQGIKKQKWKRGFATKKEALGFERDFLEKQSANPDMTFQNLYEIYMEDMAARLKQSTLLTKKTVLQTHILPFFGNKPINEIKASDVRRWQAKLMSSPNNYSQTYLKKINTELNSIINYAKNDTICRSRQLLLYFGEKTKLEDDCGICDVCIDHKIPQKQTIISEILDLLKDGKPHDITELNQLKYDSEDMAAVLEEMVVENMMNVEEDEIRLEPKPEMKP